MKRLRHDQTKPLESALWDVAASNWGTVTRSAALALSAAAVVPAPLVLGPNRLARSVLGTDTVPLYSPDLPVGGRSRHARKETFND
jgi:D-lactate dehydrogenase